MACAFSFCSARKPDCASSDFSEIGCHKFKSTKFRRFPSCDRNWIRYIRTRVAFKRDLINYTNKRESRSGPFTRNVRYFTSRFLPFLLTKRTRGSEEGRLGRPFIATLPRRLRSGIEASLRKPWVSNVTVGRNRTLHAIDYEQGKVLADIDSHWKLVIV